MPITKAAAADKKLTFILLIPLRLATERRLPNAFFRHLCGRACFEKAVYAQHGHFPLETGRAIRNTRLRQVEGSVETPDVRYESGILAPKRPWGDFLLSVAIKLRIDIRQYSTLLLVPGVPDQFSKSTRPKVQHIARQGHLESREPSGRIDAHV